MKQALIISLILLIGVSISATVVGKIRFINGEVLYRENQNKAYAKTNLGAPVHRDGCIKTGLDSEAEITWNNDTVSIIGANQELRISKLMDELNAKPSFRNKLLDNMNNLRLKNSRRATSVAGIRREEAEVTKDSLLYWSTEDSISIDEAIALYEADQKEEAIPIFEKVIYQGPLKSSAELAHAYLILIYTDQGKLELAEKELKILAADFPGSQILEDLPTE